MSNKTSSSSSGNLKRKVNIKAPAELTVRQEEFMEISMDPKTELMFCAGPAGTSKTYLSILSALELLNKKTVSSMLYVRSAVESSDSKIGFLPGEEGMKLEPYLRPLRDKLHEFLTPTDVSFLYTGGKVDAEHVGYARGQDWKNKAIIIDEAQNLTYKELVTLTTRAGENCKIFIVGDPMQSDIKNKSGFNKFCEIFNTDAAKAHGIQTFYFTKDDIVRSSLVKFIIQELEKEENRE